jgi:3-oxoacyl-[acyl-carrier protein] reductase
MENNLTTRKYALVTGASRGIGRAVSTELARMGYHVLINYSANTAAAEATLQQVREAGSDGTLMPFDVTQAEQVQTAIQTWQDNHADDYISVLVNNAGIRRDNLLALMPQTDWAMVVATTLDGFYNVTQPLLPPMQLHKFGRIINIASVSGMRGLPGQTNYSAAKGGLIAATKALAQEVARKNITVNAIAPGFIKTDMTEGLDEATLRKTIPAGRFGTPEEVAHAVGFLASPRAGYITGNVLSINGGLYT